MSRWIILRTSGGQTLPLMTSLCEAGFDAWTPARPIRKVVRAGTRTEQRLDMSVPILPTFVFARERDIVALAEAAAQPFGPHPSFSIFRYDGRVPLIGDVEVTGLRDEENKAAKAMQEIRDAETHAEAERIRIAAIKSASARRRAEQASERERRKAEQDREIERRNALRAERSTVEPGTPVHVTESTALAGVTGIFEEVDGTYARVRFGTQSWKIDGWRIMPADLDAQAA